MKKDSASVKDVLKEKLSTREDKLVGVKQKFSKV